MRSGKALVSTELDGHSGDDGSANNNGVSEGLLPDRKNSNTLCRSDFALNKLDKICRSSFSDSTGGVEKHQKAQIRVVGR